MDGLNFYRKELENVEHEIIIEKELMFKINIDSSFIFNEKRKLFLLYFRKNNEIIKLPFEQHSNIFELANEDSIEHIELITIKTEDGDIQFRTAMGGKHSHNLNGIAFTKESIKICEKSLPDFFKSDFYYKEFDVEWVGDNFQAIDYMTRRLVTNSHCEKIAKQDIDKYLEWKESIPKDVKYYEERGYKIEIVSSGEKYPAFPFTYVIHTPNEEIIENYGISNVFETEDKARERALFKTYDMINGD